MSVKEITSGLPWWVKWVAIPVVALVIFGGLFMTLISFVVGLLFKVLLFAAVVAGLVFVVRKFMGSTTSKSDW